MLEFAIPVKHHDLGRFRVRQQNIAASVKAHTSRLSRIVLVQADFVANLSVQINQPQLWISLVHIGQGNRIAMARGKADRRKTAKVNLRLVQLPLGARLVNIRNPAYNWAQLVIFDERADLVEARREQAEALARFALV